MNRSRVTGDLASHGNIFVDIANDRVGIGSTIPAQKLSLPDNARIALGDSADLQIYHMTHLNNSVISKSSSGTLLLDTLGDLQIRKSSDGAVKAKFISDGAVELNHSNAKKFETTAYGIDITGTTGTDGLSVSGVATATTFSGSGASLTNLNGSNIASGTVPVARIGTGTKDTTTFYRGDGTFQVVSTDLVGDTSPQLGGDLDTNSHHILIDDDHEVKFGASNDLRIMHANGNANFIQSYNDNNLRIHTFGTSAQVKLQTNESQDNVVCKPNGATELYHSGNKKFETTSAGASVTGAITASTSITASGSLTTNGNFTISTTNPNIFLTDTDNDSDFRISNSNGLFEIRDITNTATRFCIKSDGKVGINETSPDTILHISHSSAPTIRLENTDTSLTSGQVVGNVEFKAVDPSGIGANVIGSVESFSDSSVGGSYGLKFRVSTSSSANYEAMRIAQNGYVSLGGQTPDAHFHIEKLTPELRVQSTNTNLGQGGTVCTYSHYTSDPTTPTGVGEVFRIKTTSATSNGSDYTTELVNRAGAGGGESRIALGQGAVGAITFSTHASGSATERLSIDKTGTTTFKGDSTGTEQVKIQSSGGGTGLFIGNFQGIDAGDASGRLGVGKNDNALIFTNASGSQIGVFAIGNTDAIPLVFSTSNNERLRIKSTGEIYQYGFTGTSDTGADDLVLGNTGGGVNRGMTIWSNSSQNGSIAFADNDSNFRGAVQYIHNGDNLRFLTAGNETLRMTANGGTVIHKNATVHNTDSGWAALEVRANSDQHTLVLSSQSTASNTNKATLGFKLHPSNQNERTKVAIIADGSGGGYGQADGLLFCFDNADSNDNATSSDEKFRMAANGRFGINAAPNANEYLYIKPDGNNVLDMRYELNSSTDIRHKYFDDSGTYRGGHSYTRYSNSTRYPNLHHDFYWTTHNGSSTQVSMRLTREGYLLQQYVPAFGVAKSDHSGQIGSGVYVFNQVHFNNGSHYSTSNGRFTAPKAGAYCFSFSLQLYGSNAAHCRFQINGSDVFSGGTSSPVYEDGPDSHETISTTMVLNLAQGDYVTVTRNANTRGMQSSFCGHLIG